MEKAIWVRKVINCEGKYCSDCIYLEITTDERIYCKLFWGPLKRDKNGRILRCLECLKAEKRG